MVHLRYNLGSYGRSIPTDSNTQKGERIPLNTQIYAEVVEQMNKLRAQYIKTVQITTSEMNKGISNDAFPCCGSPNRDCTPWPTCCNCPVTSKEWVRRANRHLQ